MENIFVYYVIIGIAFVLTSYITIYRPAMRRTAEMLEELLNKNTESNDFIIEKINKFLSWPYRYITLTIYSLAILLLYPLVALATMVNNKSLIVGFSDGILNGLLEINE